MTIETSCTETERLVQPAVCDCQKGYNEAGKQDHIPADLDASDGCVPVSAFEQYLRVTSMGSLRWSTSSCVGSVMLGSLLSSTPRRGEVPSWPGPLPSVVHRGLRVQRLELHSGQCASPCRAAGARAPLALWPAVLGW